MKTLISITRILAIAVAMFSFASGAWAEHEGDGVVHDADEVTDTEVVGEEGILDEEVIGEEEVVDDSEVIGEEEVVDESDVTGGEEVLLETGVEGEEGLIYTMTGEGGEVYPTEAYDSEGNVIYLRGDTDAEVAGTEIEMTPLMSATGASGVALADTAADQVAIDSAADVSLDVAGSTQAEFASPIDVATVAADGSVSDSSGGTATRISGGHFSAPAGSQQ